MHVSHDKILHDSWSISAALARGFSDRHFKRAEDPGDEDDLDGTFLHSVDVVTLYDLLYHVKMLVLRLGIHTACIL